MNNDTEKKVLASADSKRLPSAGSFQLPSIAPDEEPDGRELLKNIGTLEEYYNLTTTYGHAPNEPQDHTNAEEPQDKDKRFHKKSP